MNKYYGHINELKSNDKRLPLFRKQLKNRGFDETELWSLFQTIANISVDILSEYKSKIKDMNLIRDIDEIISGFQVTIRDTPYTDTEYDKDRELNAIRTYVLRLSDFKDSGLIELILPRLAEFAKVCPDELPSMTKEQYSDNLNSIVHSLEMLQGTRKFNTKKYNHGILMFLQHFFDLWW